MVTGALGVGALVALAFVHRLVLRRSNQATANAGLVGYSHNFPPGFVRLTNSFCNTRQQFNSIRVVEEVLVDDDSAIAVEKKCAVATGGHRDMPLVSRGGSRLGIANPRAGVGFTAPEMLRRSVAVNT